MPTPCPLSPEKCHLILEMEVSLANKCPQNLHFMLPSFISSTSFQNGSSDLTILSWIQVVLQVLVCLSSFEEEKQDQRRIYGLKITRKLQDDELQMIIGRV
uniref:Uncharacterized protein n=1 Tax=Populus davidiana TaxID=266767 RepID=A0A6M2EAW3_9ROSI